VKCVKQMTMVQSGAGALHLLQNSGNFHQRKLYAFATTEVAQNGVRRDRFLDWFVGARRTLCALGGTAREFAYDNLAAAVADTMAAARAVILAHSPRDNHLTRAVNRRGGPRA
jgi:hypothetical protein